MRFGRSASVTASPRCSSHVSGRSRSRLWSAWFPRSSKSRERTLKPIEHKRSELAELPAEPLLTAGELAEIDRVGDNTNHMVLKGGTPAHRGDERADAWPMDAALQDTAGRWGIVPERDLVMHG